MFAALVLSALVAAAPTPRPPTPRPGEAIYEQVHENALVGEFAALPHASRQPALIVLGGLEGGIPEDGLGLARQGYATFAVAYFGAPPLGKVVDRVPLETVSRALDYLAARPEVDPARIGIVGISKGAELALLAAARDPRIKSVAVISPSGYAWFAPAFDGDAPRSSWVVNGGPVAYIPPDAAAVAALAKAYDSGGTFAFRDLYDASLASAGAATVASATIPVERIGGPILCVAGDDDREWDSAGACKAIAARRKDAHRDGADQVAIERGAGHATSLAGRGRPDVVQAGKMKIRFGGSLDANSRAAADIWTRTLTFFARTL
jgi:dienelactone hydrolase